MSSWSLRGGCLPSACSYTVCRSQLLLGLITAPSIGIPLAAQTIRVDATPGHAAKTFFIPTETLGAGIDRLNFAATDKLADSHESGALPVGRRLVSYHRQNTELISKRGIGIRRGRGAT